MILRLSLFLALMVPAFSQSLSFEVYRSKVEPIFAKKRPTHARCIVCHAPSGSAFRLEPLEKDATTWTEEQSRKNFTFVSRLVKPGGVIAGFFFLVMSVRVGGPRDLRGEDNTLESPPAP